MTKQYIPLTTVLENYKTELSEAGVYNLRQLFETVQQKKINIYYQLAYTQKIVRSHQFPIGEQTTGSLYANGKIQPYTKYKCTFGYITIFHRPISHYELGIDGYSQCLDARIDNKNNILFYQFFNSKLFDYELDDIFTKLDISKLSINPDYKNCMSNLVDYFNDNNIDYERIRKDSLSNQQLPLDLRIDKSIQDDREPITPFFYFDDTEDDFITDTPNNFYLLRDDVEQWVGENTQSNLQQGSTNIIRSQDIIIDFNQLSNLFRRKTAHIKIILSEAEKHKSENNTITYREILDLEWKGGGFEDDTNRTFKELFLNRVNNLINL